MSGILQLYLNFTNTQTRNECSPYFTVIKARSLQLDSTTSSLKANIHKLLYVNFGSFVQVLYFSYAMINSRDTGSILDK